MQACSPLPLVAGLQSCSSLVRTGLVNLLPLWLAPNLITLAASTCIAIAYAVNALYLPDFTGRAHGDGDGALTRRGTDTHGDWGWVGAMPSTCPPSLVGHTDTGPVMDSRGGDLQYCCMY